MHTASQHTPPSTPMHTTSQHAQLWRRHAPSRARFAAHACALTLLDDMAEANCGLCDTESPACASAATASVGGAGGPVAFFSACCSVATASCSSVMVRPSFAACGRAWAHQSELVRARVVLAAWGLGSRV